MATLADVLILDDRIEERTKFEERLLSFVADMLQPQFKKRKSALKRDADDLIAAWGNYTGRDVAEDLKYRLELRHFSDLDSEIDGSVSFRL